MEFSGEFTSRFVIVSELVKRPSAMVYRAKDRELHDREVALKIFVDRPGSNQNWIERFDKEMGLIRSASHPVLVPIVASGCEQGAFYIAMELIEGRNLRDLLKENANGLEIEQCLEIVRQLGEGLSELHELGGLHGHLDSRAILFKGDHVRLAGYYPRVVGEIHRSATSEGRLIIDPHYIAPEQITGSDKADYRADIFSLTVLLYEMLTGKRPYSASNPLQTAMLRLSGSPPSPQTLRPDIPALLDAAVVKGLSRSPEERFRTLDEMLDALSGGVKTSKNPFVGMEQSMRLGSSTETVRVTLSPELLRDMLKTQTPQELPLAKPPVSSVAPAREMESSAVEQTVMGMQAFPALKANLVQVSGKERGKKFALEKPQTIIGRDPSCDLCIDDKNAPKRYAMITQRGTEYIIEPLSPQGLRLNDQNQEQTDDLILKRGDVINVGDTKFRYVAPGEVFTLQDNVADRTIDRPKSKIPKLAIGAGVMAAVILGAITYVVTQNAADRSSRKKAKEAQTAEKRDAKLVSLIREADELYTKGALWEPVGANAKEKYEEVLAYDGNHTYAKKRLADIEVRSRNFGEEQRRKQQRLERIAQLELDAKRFFDRGEYVFPPGKNARETYQEILNVDPTNESARQRIAEIDSLVGDLLGKVEIRLAKASVYRDLGQYVEPEGENAFEEIKAIFKVDGKNEEASNLLLEMAAESIYEGDVAKSRKRLQEMRRAYNTAQTLGVDPAYVEERLRGTELMQKSKADIIIFNRREEAKEAENEKTDTGYLSREEIERRVSALRIQRGGEGDDGKILIELGAGGKGNS